MLSMNSLLTLLAMLSMLTLQCNQCIDCIADHCHPVKVKEYLWNSYLLDVRPMPTEIACLLVSLNLFLELRKKKRKRVYDKICSGYPLFGGRQIGIRVLALNLFPSRIVIPVASSING